MGVQCKKCGHLNSEGSKICSWCKSPLGTVKISKIDELLLKQEELELRHRRELSELKKELTLLRNELNKASISVGKAEQEGVSNQVLSNKNLEIKADSVKKEIEPLVLESNEKKSTEKEVKASRPINQPVVKKVITPRKPSEFELKLKKAIEPLYDGLDLVSKIYTKYKTEGKLPIFFMTIAGIVAILFGFGYLMQYSLSAAGIYQGLIKVSLGFAAAVVSIIIGIRLSKKESDLKEYASALISLGIILNYVMIYYLTELGHFPALSESLLGFLLIVANTGIAIVFALKFEAKVIAVLFIVGGAFTPFYLNANEDGTLYYLYLWFLTVGACFVSIKIGWKTLQYLAFSISALLLEIVVFIQEPTSFVYIGYYHLFAYLFFYFTFFERGKIKQELDKIDLVVLASNLGFFSWNLFSSSQVNLFNLGIIYLLNALVFIALLVRYSKSLDKVGRLVFLIIIGLFVGLAIPSFFNQSVMGLFWSIEAVMLVYLGFLYGNDFVRKEGYLLLGFSLVKLGWHSAEIVYFWNETLWHSGLLNFAVLGLVITLCWVFGQQYKRHFNQLEEFLFGLFREIVPVWLAIIFFLLTYGSFGSWSFPMAVVPLFGLVYWSKIFKTITTVWFGYAHLILLLFGVFTSVELVHSIHFTDQLLFAQVSIIGFIASLWSLKSYFKLIGVESDYSFKVAEGLRVVFFCLLPLLFVHLVRKIDISFVGSAFWVSVLITYFLHKKLKYFALSIELMMLVFISFVFVIGTLDDFGIILGIVVSLSLVFLEKGYDKEHLEKSVFKDVLTFLPYIFVVLLWFVIFKLTYENASVSFAVSAVMLVGTVYFKDKLALVNASYVFGTKLSMIMMFACFAVYGFSESFLIPIFSVFYLFIIGLLLHNQKSWYDLKNKINRWRITFILHQLLIMITVAVILDLLYFDVIGPLSSVLLVVHAIILTFIALKQGRPFINKLSMVLFGITLLKIIGIDISEFTMIQKVIVFIILGLILLAASYGYVKLKKRFEIVEDTLEKDVTIE